MDQLLAAQQAGEKLVATAWHGQDIRKDAAGAAGSSQQVKQEPVRQGGMAQTNPNPAAATAFGKAQTQSHAVASSAWSSPEMQALRMKAAGTIPLQHAQQHPKPQQAFVNPQPPQQWKAAVQLNGPPPPGWSAGPVMWGPVGAAPLQVAAARHYSARDLALQDVDLQPWRSEPVAIPSYAAWFELGAVHELERRALPDLVATEEKEKRYVAARDQIVRLYRDYPHKVLTASDAMSHVADSADVVVRVHALLEYWGLINAEADGRVRLAKLKEAVKAADKTSVKRCAVTGEPLERVYFYHHDTAKHPDMLLSPNAYAHGMLPPTMTLHDLRRRAATDAMTPNMPSFDDWTEDESARLLDALIKCGDNWDAVAQYVGGKSMEQCVLQLARLPIADRYLQDTFPVSADPTPKTLPDRLDPHTALLRAFPAKWSPAWRALLEEMLAMLADRRGSLQAVDAAASQLASAAPGAHQHSGWQEDAEEAGDIWRGDSAWGKMAARAPWIRALEWPQRTFTSPAVGSFLVMLTEEAGKFRGRVAAVRRRKAGVLDVELCGGGVRTMQLRRGEYRVVSEQERAVVEAVLGCGFLELAAGEKRKEKEGGEEGTLDAVGMREEKATSKLTEEAAVWRRLRERVGRAGEQGGCTAAEAVQCAVAAMELRVGTYERGEEEVRELRWRAETAKRRETEDACRLLAQSPLKRHASSRPRRAMMMGQLLDGDGAHAMMDPGDDGG